MKKKEIDPKIAAVVIAALVILGGVIFWVTTNPNPGQVDLTKKTKAEIEDWDPPKPGQPGYRERLTDPPK